MYFWSQNGSLNLVKRHLGLLCRYKVGLTFNLGQSWPLETFKNKTGLNFHIQISNWVQSDHLQIKAVACPDVF